MIPRYAREQMVSIWSPETKFRIWFEIEAHATDALAELGVVPKEAAAKVWEKGRDAKFDVARIDEIEREVKHDVIAFLTHLSEIVGPEARFVHQGMTSSDVLDTCLNVQLMRAADLLIDDTDALAGGAEEARLRIQDDAHHRAQPRHPCRAHHLRRQAGRLTMRNSPAPGTRLVTARAEIATCAISGAVGTFANIDPRVEEHVAKAMGLVGRAGLDPGDSARPPCRLFRGAGRGGLVAGTAGGRDPPSAAHRSAGSGGIFLARPEGLLAPCRTSAIPC